MKNVEHFQKGSGDFQVRPYRRQRVCPFSVPSSGTKKVDGLLVAGRSFSSDVQANNMVNLIPHCIAMRQAAGTAPALALKQGISPRKID